MIYDMIVNLLFLCLIEKENDSLALIEWEGIGSHWLIDQRFHAYSKEATQVLIYFGESGKCGIGLISLTELFNFSDWLLTNSHRIVVFNV